MRLFMSCQCLCITLPLDLYMRFRRLLPETHPTPPPAMQYLTLQLGSHIEHLPNDPVLTAWGPILLTPCHRSVRLSTPRLLPLSSSYPIRRLARLAVLLVYLLARAPACPKRLAAHRIPWLVRRRFASQQWPLLRRSTCPSGACCNVEFRHALSLRPRHLVHRPTPSIVFVLKHNHRSPGSRITCRRRLPNHLSRNVAIRSRA